MPDTGVIVTLKKLFTGQQIFPKTKTGAVYGEDGRRLDNIVSEVEALLDLIYKSGVVTSENVGFAEVAQWSDSNPDGEDRTCYFVSVSKTETGITMNKARSDSDIRGVTIDHPAFSANASSDKFVNGELKPEYGFVAFAGFATVYDYNRCTVGSRCISDNYGTAIPSPNTMGYEVIERVDNERIRILVESSADMLVRIKKDIVELVEGQKKVEQIAMTLEKVMAGASLSSTTTFKSETEIEEKFSDNSKKVTVFVDSQTIVESNYDKDGIKTLEVKTVFNEDGSISKIVTGSGEEE